MRWYYLKKKKIRNGIFVQSDPTSDKAKIHRNHNCRNLRLKRVLGVNRIVIPRAMPVSAELKTHLMPREDLKWLQK